MKRTSLFIPEQMLAQFSEIARKRGTPMAELIRAAMEQWLKAQNHGTD